MEDTPNGCQDYFLEWFSRRGNVCGVATRFETHDKESQLEKCLFLVSSSLKNKTELGQSSFFVSRLLKNETDSSIVSRINI